MGKTIKVLKPFTEQRTGRSYQPGELVTDPAWHAPGDRRAEAYAARELVRVEERAEEDDVPVASLAAVTFLVQEAEEAAAKGEE